MATLIPHDALDSAAEEHRTFADQLLTVLSPETIVWYGSGTEGRPDFVVLGGELGLQLVDAMPWSRDEIEKVGFDGVLLSDGSRVDPMARMGRTLERIRLELHGVLEGSQIGVLFALPLLDQDEMRQAGLAAYFGGVRAIGLHDVGARELADMLSQGASPLASATQDTVRERLYPDTAFVLPRRVEDSRRGEREAARILLDAKQESVARALGTGVTVLSGVAGSGKTLVLAARARMLAAAHPEWSILVLCFNKTLKAYLQTLVGNRLGNVHVDHVTSWRHSIDLSGDEQLAAASRFGVPPMRYDAILIDEAQDFQGIVLHYLRRTLKAKRGGMLVAGDLAQAIYGDDDVLSAFEGDHLSLVDLAVNYRNTGQIGGFAWGAVFGVGKDGEGFEAPVTGRAPSAVKCVMSGPKVQLAFAATQTDQAAAIVSEIARLHNEGQFAWGEVAVLHTNWYLGKALCAALERARVPFYWITRDRTTKSMPSLIEDSVKVTTVHSCKGLEFPCVFLAGVESLKVPKQYESDDPDAIGRLRTAYVGMTRARDLLYVTYSRANPVIDRALDLEEWCEVRQYPEDFE